MTNLKTWLKRTVALSMVGIGGFIASAPSAEAGTIANQFTVSTTVNQACTAFTTPALTFPSYVSGQTGPDAAQTTFSVTCPGASVATPELVNVTFTAGTASSATSFTMTSGANNLNYALCQDASCAQPFTFGTAGTAFSITQSTASNYTVFGQIGANLTPPTGAYSQTLTATLTY